MPELELYDDQESPIEKVLTNKMMSPIIRNLSQAIALMLSVNICCSLKGFVRDISHFFIRRSARRLPKGIKIPIKIRMVLMFEYCYSHSVAQYALPSGNAKVSRSTPLKKLALQKQ